MTPATLITSTGDAIVRLAKAYARALSVQWLPPLGPSTRHDTSERAKGLISNPTLDTATDPRRLRVRAAVIEAEGLLESIRDSATENAEKLERALDEWAGEKA